MCSSIAGGWPRLPVSLLFAVSKRQSTSATTTHLAFMHSFMRRVCHVTIASRAWATSAWNNISACSTHSSASLDVFRSHLNTELQSSFHARSAFGYSALYCCSVTWKYHQHCTGPRKVLLELIKSKCLPILLHSTEVCPTNSADRHSL